ncbi:MULTISPECIES: phosphonate ABC transporter, permease protein PhnE [Bosea]|uniref:phosphonate ABC transporter, permease protein PhnE n=1 Tax=Bosea TaxID=85413 RepID=UPI0021502DB2|nr:MULTISPECIES: phosphonate ABC transporter, permease protein PhnE [Bosea]MCR4521667.1 phosphonate ABC transporter, permease protein PhnE [Bosea sp. 47.2.35]MDR6828234.1 phosphonate transport system permease protein [Bosea robiniae]MDR6897794.1 phosphonate transport system permease protein [Bosea sp. BE109]MDR7141233.1 phosphonate transport system permease protein [Bosea sp. BE168]MDR7177895.1 phosphonate transport system permease protein [Bosea sp. BE271]
MTAHQPMQDRAPMRRYPDQWERYSLRERIVQWLWLGGIAIAAAWSVSALDIEWAFFADAHEQAADLISRMWPPRWSYLPRIVQPLIETLHIATLGTMIAIIFALPVAFLAARNTTYNQATWLIGRAMLVLSRSINTVIWGLVFVAIFGPGPVAGICAVAARSVGFIAKLVAEAIEEVDAGQIEAVESTGASTLQVYGVAILPQILPVLIGTSIYRWDINVRESSVLGFVGAGGIGLLLYASINQFAWSQAIVILIAILGIVIISEALSAYVRSRIV